MEAGSDCLPSVASHRRLPIRPTHALSASTSPQHPDLTPHFLAGPGMTGFRSRQMSYRVLSSSAPALPICHNSSYLFDVLHVVRGGVGYAEHER